MQAAMQKENLTTAPSSASSRELKQRNRLRVLHVVPFLGVGGTEHGVLKVINGLNEAQFEHSICAVRGIDEEFASRMNMASRAYSAGTAKQGMQFPLFRLAKIMRQVAPHIVHTRNFGALEAIPAARLAGVPVAIHSEHGYELDILSGLPLRRRTLCRVFYGMADAVFTVTNDLRTYHAKQSWLSIDRFRVIENGVDTQRFSLCPGAAVAIRRELGIPQDRLVIGSVGRLVPIKDYPTLLRAVETLIRNGKNLHLLLVGAGPELEKLKAYAAASEALTGRVIFAGASDRIPELLNAMDIFVLPSICEGMSNTILEAMASGLPVIVSRVGGNPGLVQDGRTGWLFTPQDSETLAELLVQLSDSPGQRREFGEEARRRAVEQFSLAGMLDHYRHLYQEMAERRDVWKGN
jgi:sugar transferase (PEP-CTERM/EpsH1 system associated)